MVWIGLALVDVLVVELLSAFADGPPVLGAPGVVDADMLTDELGFGRKEKENKGVQF